jgi:hypothetical protein
MRILKQKTFIISALIVVCALVSSCGHRKQACAAYDRVGVSQTR